MRSQIRQVQQEVKMQSAILPKGKKDVQNFVLMETRISSASYLDKMFSIKTTFLISSYDFLIFFVV
jgi:hypothetical protein